MNLKDSRFLRLTHNCLPSRPPLLWTAIFWIATDFYEMPNFTLGLWYVWIGLLWFYYLISLATESQMDIFADYRKKRED